MNLTTHCPRCATAFLVTQEQLGEAQGWVRCGMCQEVFIAQAHTAAPSQALPLEAPLPHQQASLHTDEPQQDDDSTAALTTTPTSSASTTPLPNRPEPSQALPARTTSPSPSSVPRKRRRSGRLLLGVLLALLALQIGMQSRHSLVSAFPQAASWLQSQCPDARCGLRQISAVAIEDSSFTTTGANLFHLSAMVANHSNLALDAPVLALTLTDAADQVLARKVYSPQDWGPAVATLPAATRAPAALWIKWEDASSTQRVVGYRLQAYYP